MHHERALYTASVSQLWSQHLSAWSHFLDGEEEPGCVLLKQDTAEAAAVDEAAGVGMGERC